MKQDGSLVALFTSFLALRIACECSRHMAETAQRLLAKQDEYIKAAKRADEAVREQTRKGFSDDD